MAVHRAEQTIVEAALSFGLLHIYGPAVLDPRLDMPKQRVDAFCLMQEE